MVWHAMQLRRRNAFTKSVFYLVTFLLLGTKFIWILPAVAGQMHAQRPAGYSDWLGQFPDIFGSDADMTADPDLDGFANLVEFATGTNPTQPDSPASRELTKPDDGPALRYVLSWADTPLEPAAEVSKKPSGEFQNVSHVPWASLEQTDASLSVDMKLGDESRFVRVRPEIPLDLSTVSLAGNFADPLSLVEIKGLPADAAVNQFYAVFKIESSSGSLHPAGDAPVLPVIERNGTAQLVTPLMSPEGSTIKLILTDGYSSSKELILELDALPSPREDAYSNTIVQLERLIKVTAEGLGLEYPHDLDDFISDPGTTPPFFVPLVQAYHRIADPANPDALAQSNVPDEARRLINRILAGRRLDDAYRQLADFYASGDSMLDESREALAGMNTIQTLDTVPKRESTGVLSAAGELPGLYSVNNASQLSELMLLYKQSRDLQQDLDLATQVFGTYLAGAGLLAPGLGNSAAAVATRAGVEGLKSFINMSGAVASTVSVARNFAPCCITSLETELDPPGGIVRNEDAMEPQVTLASAVASARSEKFNVTKEILTKAFEKLAGVGTAKLRKRFSSDIADMGIDAGKDAISDQLVQQFAGRELYFTWTEIDMMGSPQNPSKWLNHAQVPYGHGSGTILEQVGTGQDKYAFRLTHPDAYQQRRSVLRLETDPRHFPVGTYATLAQHSHAIGFNEIQMSIEPDRILISKPGTYVFDIVVENSILDQTPHLKRPISITPSHGDITRLDYLGNGRFVMEYTTPDPLPDDFEVVLTAEADATTGLRGQAKEPPRRSGFALVTARGDVRLSGPGCVNPELRFDVQAETTPEQADLVWSVSSGSINPGAHDNRATVTLPENPPSELLVSATYNGPGGQVRDELTVKIGDCGDFVSFSLGSFTKSLFCSEFEPDNIGEYCGGKWDLSPRDQLMEVGLNMYLGLPEDETTGFMTIAWRGKVGQDGEFPATIRCVTQTAGFLSNCNGTQQDTEDNDMVQVKWSDDNRVVEVEASGTLLTVVSETYGVEPDDPDDCKGGMQNYREVSYSAHMRVRRVGFFGE
jgi:hypothetical protein